MFFAEQKFEILIKNYDFSETLWNALLLSHLKTYAERTISFRGQVHSAGIERLDQKFSAAGRYHFEGHISDILHMRYLHFVS